VEACTGQFIALPPHPKGIESLRINGNSKLTQVSFEKGSVERALTFEFVVSPYTYKDEADFQVQCDRNVFRFL
jgi:hypothetical protein